MKIQRQLRTSSEPLRVYVLDLLAVVPYYAMSLCAALGRVEGVQAACGSTTYHRDAGFHVHRGIRLDGAALNISWRLGWAWPAVRRTARLAEYLLNLIILAARFTVRRPGVLHVQFLPLIALGLPFEVWLLRYCRTLGIRLALTVHNILPHDSDKTMRVRWSEVYGLMNALICHDPPSAIRLSEEFGIDPSDITVIPHGPMFSGRAGLGQAAAKRELGYGENECLVLCQGIVRPYKGIGFLLESWRAVAQAAPRARLAIAGHAEPELRKELEGAVERLGIAGSVRLDWRFLPARTVEVYHEAADILVYPYREITTSGALMTGMAAGKATVATRLAAFEELLRQDESALLVEYGNQEALSEALLRLASDEAFRQHLGEGVKRVSCSLPGWDELAEMTADFYFCLAQTKDRLSAKRPKLDSKADANV